MKRHPQLRPLADDHRRALVLARSTRRARRLEKIWPEVVRRFASELEPHFQVEERWPFPLLDAAGERALAEQARAGHTRLRDLIRAEPTAATAADFAAVLERHVRFEERELFPRAERLLAPPDTKMRTQNVAEAVRQACINAALAGYENAALAGLCHEGAWEAAVSAMRMVALDEVKEPLGESVAG